MIKPASHSAPRVDHLFIAEMVEPRSRVLDVGCGDGALLHLLAETKMVDGRGVEISREGVNACVARGLSVIPRPTNLQRPWTRISMAKARADPASA